MIKPIGGFFELDLLSTGSDPPHNDAIKLDSGRNALKYLLKYKKVKKIYIPYYICDVITDVIQELGIESSNYYINEEMEPEIDFSLKDNEKVLYVNYFGLKDKYLRELVDDHFIIDNSQSFYSDPTNGLDTFYSPRKFFGLPDGGLLYTDIDNSHYESLEYDHSYDRCSHLLKRIDIGPEMSYNDFLENSQMLEGQKIKKMSKLTERLLMSIDHEKCRDIRIENFSYLHESLKDMNQISIDLNIDEMACPMIYPFILDEDLRDHLIEKKIFVAKYWPGIEIPKGQHRVEEKLISNLVPLPIDQRYGTIEMQRIIDTVYEYQS